MSSSEHLKPGDVEAGGGCVAGPHPESGVAGLLGRGGEFVTQIREQSPVVGRVRQPLADQVVVGGGSQDVDVDEDGRSVVVRRAAAADKGDAPTIKVRRAGQDVARHRVGDAGCDRFVLSANDIAEAQASRAVRRRRHEPSRRG